MLYTVFYSQGDDITALTLKPYMAKITEFVGQLGKSGAHLIEESPDE